MDWGGRHESSELEVSEEEEVPLPFKILILLWWLMAAASIAETLAPLIEHLG